MPGGGAAHQDYESIKAPGTGRPLSDVPCVAARLTSPDDDAIVVGTGQPHMPDRNEREIDTILDRHDEAFRAFREASHAFDAAIGALRDTLNAVQAANHAQGDAIDALRAANQAALRLLRGTDSGHHA